MNSQKSFSTAEVATMAGVHRDTLLRWLRERTMPEPRRDRHGWRIFTPQEAEAIVAFAKGDEWENKKNLFPDNETAISRLEALDWNFTSAKTSYLTHSLHPYPAKFIPQIPNALIQELSSVGETIGDIFCGSGTTLLEGLQLKRHVVGIDANPLATLISQAKTTTLRTEQFKELAMHRSACERILEATESRIGDLFHGGQLFWSSGWRPDLDVCEFWFAPHVVEELAELRSIITQIHDEAVQRLCKVAFSAIIVAVSKQDSDTRYVRREKVIEPGDTVKRYLSQIDAAVTAVREMSDLIEERFTCEVLETNILETPDIQPFDLMITSPPYPNAYSYHLYHRFRLLWLGYDPEHFKKIEIGSHRKYSAKSRNRATPVTFQQEFKKIFQWLRKRLRDRRYACFVIGDSTISGTRIDNTSLIATTGKSAGFREVARINRKIAPTRKSFNPKIGKIKSENILILQKV